MTDSAQEARAFADAVNRWKVPGYNVGITEVPVAPRYDTDLGTVLTDQDDYDPATFCLLPDDEPGDDMEADCE